MKDSAKYVSRARQGFEEFPCFWGRGVVPASWSEAALHGPVVNWWHEQGSEPDDDSTAQVTICSDGSGGPDSRDPRLRRVAFGAVRVKQGEGSAWAVSAAVWGTVGGRQTVPRAEVVGAHHGLKLARAKEEVSIGIDASYVVGGAAKRSMARGSNADVWRPFFLELVKFERPPLVIKVRAHCEKRGYRSEASPSVTFANFAADLLAEGAANDAAVSSDTVRRVAEVDAMAKAILTRLVIIDMEAAKAGRQELMVELRSRRVTERTMIRTRAEVSGHRLKAFGKGKVRCTKCQVAVARCGVPRWLAGRLLQNSLPGSSTP